MQDTKYRQKFAIYAPSHNSVGLYLRNEGTYRQSEKNLLISDISPTFIHNMVNFVPLAAEIGSLVWGTQRQSLAFSYIGSVAVTAWHSSSGRQRNFVALSRGRHLYFTGRTSRWALACRRLRLLPLRHALANAVRILAAAARISYRLFCGGLSGVLCI